MGDAVSAGLSYTSKMSMSELDDYSDLYAQAGGFDIPSSAKLGLSFKGTNGVRINFDIEHTQFSEVDSVGNPMANIFNCPAVVFMFSGQMGGDVDSCFGGENGAGFGWEDMTTYKLGVEWASNGTSTWRFGYSYGEQPIQEADVLFNILAPGVMEQHFTVGLSKDKWNFSLMYAPSKSITGVSAFDPGQLITLEMKQLEFEFSYAF
jgi:long-chain fatty acid transport protein